MSWDASKHSASSNVVFAPAPGATVYVAGNIRVYSDHVTFQDMTLENPNNPVSKGDVEAYNYDPYGLPSGNDVGYITFQNIVARNFNIYSAHDVSVLGGSYGPSAACGSAQPGLTQYGGGNNSLREQPSAPDPNNILISGVTVHNIMSYSLTNCHTEGIAVFGANNVTVTQSKFYGNDVYDLLLQSNSGPVNGITLENNWFANPTSQAGSGTGSATVGFSGSSSDFANSLVANNSFNAAVSFDANGLNPTYQNFRVIGNIGVMPYSGYCLRTLSYAYNVWQNSSCTGTDRNLNGGSMPFANASDGASMDYHLTGGVAQDLVPVSADPTRVDYDSNPPRTRASPISTRARPRCRDRSQWRGGDRPQRTSPPRGAHDCDRDAQPLRGPSRPEPVRASASSGSSGEALESSLHTAC